MYVELYCRSYYSFLEGTSSPDSLAHQAAAQGMPALALTDRNGLYGALAFHRDCRALGIKPIIGAQLTIEGGDEIVVLCASLEGYTKLSLLITDAHRGRDKGDPLITWQHLQRLSGGGLICLVGGKLCPVTAESVARYRALFGEGSLYIALAHHHEAGDKVLCRRLAAFAAEHGLPVVATNAVCYGKKTEGHLHDVLLCIKHHVTLSTSHHQRPGNHQRYLKSAQTMCRLFRDCPEAIANTVAIAERCDFSLDFSSYRVPDFPIPDGHTVDSYLEHLCWQRISERYQPVTEIVKTKVKEELALIRSLRLAGYFLVVWDIVEYARLHSIPVQGRGSAANSIVSYVLGITPVDPVAHKLFLGRFIHEGMTEAPDIDLDFAATRQEGVPNREDVIQYIYKRYGSDHVAMVCTYVTFQARSAIREVGKVLELPEHLLDQMARLVGRYRMEEVFEELQRTPEMMADLQADSWKHFKELVLQIADIPRHIGIHVGGMIIASRPIAELVPLEPARMEGRVVCQWDKDMVGDAGLIKVDILGLGMLAVLREAQCLIRESLGIDINFATLPLDDAKVYENIGRADTVGLFQVESRAQMQSLPRVRPRNFDELGVQIALIRPGPLQGNMVSPYIKRKQGDEAVSYIHPSLKPILQDTLGVILFQEQVLMVAVAIAGFSSSQAADLRRAMSRKRSQEAMQRLKQAFLDGAKKNKIPTVQAETVYYALEGFALYGFCKSHALSFAKISYISAWLKEYHPAPFLAALLNNQPMGFYPSKTLIDDGARHGVITHPVDINVSKIRSHVVDPKRVQLGFNMVKGIDQSVAQMVVASRDQDGMFGSLRGFVQRIRVRRQITEHLIQAGAFDRLGLDRRELLWQLWLLQRMGLFVDDLFEGQQFSIPALPTSNGWDLLRGECQSQGFSAQRHPLALLRERLSRQGVLPSSALPDVQQDAVVTVAGLVVCRQRPPTAKGFAFLTLEDECGMMNVIISPQLYEKVRSDFRQSPLLQVRGKRQEFDGIINIKAIDLGKF